MTPPQHKGLVPPSHEARLIRLRDQATTATTAFREAVADALKAGGSVREVAKVTGLSSRTVRIWGNERGWPTPEQKGAREARSAEIAAFNDMIERGTKELGAADPADKP